MQTRTLGCSGIEIGAIGLGCMGLNWEYGAIRDEEAISLIHRAIDLGMTLLDTADIYASGGNEELTGRAIVGRRDEVTLSTKGGLVLRDRATYATDIDGSPRHLRAACEQSLRRLGVDHVDLYFLHRPDPRVPIEESVGALGELIDAGKIGAFGLSECSIDSLERAYRVRPFAALQSELSLWTREPLEEVVPWCISHGVAFVPYAPLGRGFLAGRFQSHRELGTDDFRRIRQPRFQAEAFEANLPILHRLRSIADRLSATPAQIALAWLLAQDRISCRSQVRKAPDA
jgi:aryl-alcohol dehydrogenase-like predicted oxidoreductase